VARHAYADVGLVAHQRLSALDPAARALHGIVRSLHRLGESPDVEALALVVAHWPVADAARGKPSELPTAA
jgi:hypothetical protein